MELTSKMDRRALLVSAASTVGSFATDISASSKTDSPSSVSTGHYVNVRDFGAKADGETDDTKAVQAAADSLVSGGILFFPTGSYALTQVRIQSNTWVLGAGGGSVLVSRSKVPVRGVITNADQVTGNVHLRVSNITIQRTVALATDFNDHVFFKNSSFICIEDTTQLGVATDGGSNKAITLEGCQYGWIVRNYCKNIGDNCIAVNWNGSRQSGYHTIANNTTEVGSWTHSHIVATSDHTKILDNVFIGGTFGVELGNDVDSVTVRGNECIGCGVFISPSGSNFEISENTALDPGRGSIYVNSAFGPTRGHVIRNNNVTTIYCNGAGNRFEDVLIEGNKVHGNLSIGDGSGIVVQSVENALVRNNTCHGHARFGVHFQTTRNAVVEGNVCFGNRGHGIQMDIGSPSYSAIVRSNVCYSNQGFGFRLEQPQNWTFVDNEGWGNSSGLVSVVNPLLRGRTPFKSVRISGFGPPSFYGAPGSTYYRLDGGSGSSLYVKESADSSSDGWVGTTR
jgi:nitrous oxidase accessory protein NosD